MSDEFYIGYEPEMPPALAGRIRVAAVALVCLAMVLAGVLVTAQGRFATAVFDYGRAQTFEGRVVEYPHPAIEVPQGTGGTRWYWLVGPGKDGATRLMRGLDGRHVRLSGSLIERDGEGMIEVVPESVSTTGSKASPLPPPREMGLTTIYGEIVDSKCHLGVMKPGEGPTHRDCAVRCLLGRIPPMLVFREGAQTRRIPLVAAAGDDLEQLPSTAGRPVRVRGTLLERGGQEFLATSVFDIEVVETAARVSHR